MDQFSSDLIHLSPDAIVVERGERQRRIFTVEDLKPSIALYGIFNPLIINREHRLIAGERRLAAAKELGLTSVPCRFLEDLDPLRAQLIELEENVKRQDLSWQDQAKAIRTIHELYCKLDKNWFAADTAESLHLNPGWVSKNIRLANAIEDGNEKIANASAASEAYSILSRQDQRAAGRELETLLSVEPFGEPEAGEDGEVPDPAIASQSAVEGGPASSVASSAPAAPTPRPAPAPISDVICGDFIEWSAQYRGPKFNFIHCDFPYGVNLFDGPQGGAAGAEATYEDTKEVFFELLDHFVKNFENFASISCHVIFWFSMKHYEPMKAIFRNHLPSMEWYPHPLVWGKSDNTGIIGDAKRHPRHTYETALFGYRGGRNVVGAKADFYNAPTDRTLHPSAKPEPVLKHFFQMVVDQQTSLLDPTCGAGSALRAADALGAARVLGIEKEFIHAEKAEHSLSNARKLRRAAKAMEEKQ